jgi:molybdenum cofactor biosynthesis enzyme MoaA
MNNPTMSRPETTAEARVVITDECNLSCEFCCMQDKEIHDSFEDATAWFIAQQMHTEVSITGGEPLLTLPRVIMFSQILRYFNPDVKLWLYTNGELLTPIKASLLKAIGFTGINVSIHGELSALQSMDYKEISRMLSLRFLISDDELSDNNREWLERIGAPVRVWQMDDCNDMPFESRYRLKDPDMKWR